MTEDMKAIVRRLVDEIINQGKLNVADEIFSEEVAPLAQQAFSAFRSAFPDCREDIVELVAEGDRVVGHFKCMGTHQREFLGFPPTGKRMEVDEVYFLTIRRGKVVDFCGVEDNLGRLQQLGLSPIV